MYRRVLILHGYAGSGATHWQTWLARKCRGANLQTVYPKLPNKYNPEFKQWSQALRQEFKKADSHTAIVCHSLACITALRLIESENARPGLLVLVAPTCYSRVMQSELKSLGAFFAEVNYKKISGNVGRIEIYSSDNDPWVALDETKKMAGRLKGNLRVFLKGGHLNPAAGFHTFPEVFHLITPAA